MVLATNCAETSGLNAMTSPATDVQPIFRPLVLRAPDFCRSTPHSIPQRDRRAYRLKSTLTPFFQLMVTRSNQTFLRTSGRRVQRTASCIH